MSSGFGEKLPSDDLRKGIEDALDELMIDPRRIPQPEPSGKLEGYLPIPDAEGNMLAKLMTLPDFEDQNQPMVVVDIAPLDSIQHELFNYYYRSGRVLHFPIGGQPKTRGADAQHRLCEKLTEIQQQWNDPGEGLLDLIQ